MLLSFAGDAAEGKAFASRLGALDRKLSMLTAKGNFVWDEVYQLAFPTESFVWLYLHPKR
jgi:hypothetical protein